MPYALPFVAGQKLIELGGGERPMIRPNVDVRPGKAVDVVADLNQPLPLESGAYDGVLSIYALEHVSWRNVRSLLGETFRILKPGGRAVFVTANLYEQAKYIVSRESEGWTDKEVCCIFGDNDYQENTHRSGWSPEYAFRMFRQIGFSDIMILPHGELRTDMVIEAAKPMPEIKPELWTPEQRKAAFGRDYFDGGRTPVGGYAREGYWDFPIHWATAREVMRRKPESVLEIGVARGYVLKRLEDAGVPVMGLEVSHHCYLTRVVEPIVEWDITQTPWPVKDKAFDVAFSAATLEHIPEDKIEAVAGELDRVSKRGLHGIDFGHHDDGFDKTHCSLHDKSWWMERLPKSQEIVDKEELEKGPANPPAGDGRLKLNCGSFSTMFFHGWINIDIHPLDAFAKQHGYTYRQHDLRKGIPYEDGRVDAVYHAHFLEHLTFNEGQFFLKECRRVMKPGAIMRIILPDAGLLSKMAAEGVLGEFDEINEGCAHSPSQAGKLWSLLFAGHQSSYDWQGIEHALTQAGFDRSQRMGFRKSQSNIILRETLDMFPSLSLFVEATR